MTGEGRLVKPPFGASTRTLWQSRPGSVSQASRRPASRVFSLIGCRPRGSVRPAQQTPTATRSPRRACGRRVVQLVAPGSGRVLLGCGSDPACRPPRGPVGRSRTSPPRIDHVAEGTRSNHMIRSASGSQERSHIWGELVLIRLTVDGGSAVVEACRLACARPAPGRPQAPRDCRGARHSAGRDSHRRGPQRCDPSDPAARGGGADPRQTGTVAAPPEASLCRPRLRPRCLPRSGPTVRDHPYIARRGTEHGSGLGVHRWVVEGAVALLHWFRRLRIRWEIRDDVHQAFITLGWVRHTHSDCVPTAQS